MPPPDLRFTEKTESAGGAFNVTPSDTVDFPTVTKGLYIGAAGSVVAVFVNGDVVTFVSPVVGVTHPWKLIRVNATGTTAGSMRGLY